MPNSDQTLTLDDLWKLITELRAEVAHLREENASLRQENLALRQENLALREENATLRKEITELKSKLNKNSRNSSLSPSQDPFRPKRSQKPSGRKQGGQPGHKGHSRKMYPPEQITKTVDVRPSSCSSCGGRQFHNESVFVEYRQVVELPPIIAEVTQYNIHTCCCGHCGKHVRPEVPKEAERGYGPRIMGFLTLLSGDSLIGKRKISSLMGYLGIRISIGAVCNVHRIACEILEAPFEAIRAKVLAQSNVNADESSWRLRSKIQWAWIAATPGATFIKIEGSRSQATFNRVFDGFQNTLTTDRYASYNSHQGDRQVCLAHIDRDFTKMSERPEAEGVIGKLLGEQLGKIFGLWKQFTVGDLTRESLQRQIQTHIDAMNAGLRIGASAEGFSSKTQSLCYDLLDRFPSLWTFLRQEGVEPTNNLAERGLRPVVILRKLSSGSQSDWGLKFTERLLSVVFTLKQRAQNVFEYLVDCFRARSRADPLPSPC
jgi:transposase